MRHCRTDLDEFGVKNAKSALQTQRNSLFAKYFANSKIPQDETRQWRNVFALANFSFACWLILGPVVQSEAFLVMFPTL